MNLKNINFGEVDAKNEILKQHRAEESLFFESFSIPERVDVEDILSGRKSFILGLKGTGKTALIRYLSDLSQKKGGVSELILFKSHVSEEDRQNLSKSSGFEIIKTGDVNTFLQDFKESWKWIIHQRIANLFKKNGTNSPQAQKLFKLTGISENKIIKSFGSILSQIKSGTVNVSAEALGVAIELGLAIEKKQNEDKASISDLNRAASLLINTIPLDRNYYIYFDELELFHQNSEQFDRDRRIIRDLVYAISQINAESSESRQRIFLCSTLRTEVLHSVLELGHEIGRDVDDYGVRLDWSEGKDAIDHHLLNLIRRKIAKSVGINEEDVWERFFPVEINNQMFYKFILNSSYYRPRDIVRLLRVARDFRETDSKFTTEHFERTATEYSKQTWLEVTEELLAVYSNKDISALQRLLLGSKTHFFKSDLEDRIRHRYKDDGAIQDLFKKYELPKVLEDLYRIGVVGNDFIVKDSRNVTRARQRWIFRGNTTLNDAERMAIHKSLWKHLSLISNYAK
ncbi:hypothetical protein LC593_36815 [Nostoc sp. CHAB 5844]|nr:hypothetical protein [Nostoc sp. CHAB 5844]